LRLPQEPLRLGECAADSAARLAATVVGLRLEPVRLLGVLSRPGNTAAAFSNVPQSIAAVFQMNAPAPVRPRSDCHWVDPATLYEVGVQAGWLAPAGHPFLD
jgi:hypothetical protein